MMDRWLSRWEGNVARYANLECVKLILPWSTPSTRFCTAELKSAVIASAMRRRFPTGEVISAVGIAYLFGADLTIQKAMIAKSVTAPIAMGVAERIGASPTLTAVFAVTTGVLGAVPAVLGEVIVAMVTRP